MDFDYILAIISHLWPVTQIGLCCRIVVEKLLTPLVFHLHPPSVQFSRLNPVIIPSTCENMQYQPVPCSSAYTTQQNFISDSFAYVIPPKKLAFVTPKITSNFFPGSTHFGASKIKQPNVSTHSLSCVCFIELYRLTVMNVVLWEHRKGIVEEALFCILIY